MNPEYDAPGNYPVPLPPSNFNPNPVPAPHYVPPTYVPPAPVPAPTPEPTPLKATIAERIRDNRKTSFVGFLAMCASLLQASYHIFEGEMPPADDLELLLAGVTLFFARD
jgi:hypothetical protein